MDTPVADPYRMKVLLAGGIGGASLVLVGQPFDTLKVRLQTSAGPSTSALQLAKQIIQKNGFAGLYRGMATPLAFVTPMYAVSFWGFGAGKDIGNALLSNKDRTKDAAVAVFAGGFSALPCTVLMTPIERIKVVLQTSGDKYKGPIEVIKALFREGGMSSLYRGFWATLVRDIPGSMAYYATYDILRSQFTRSGQDAGTLTTLFCGGMAGVANWSVAIPPDVIKSRLQSSPSGTYKGFMDCGRQMIAREGIKSLFKGIGPTMLRAVPANAACFLGYEYTYRAVKNAW